MSRLARGKLVLPRRLAAILALSGAALAGLLAEGALVGVAILLGRLANPRPYLLTHLVASGTALTGLASLLLEWRALRWASGRPLPRWPLPLLGAGLVGLAGYGFYLEPRWLATPVVEVTLEDLPPGLDGLRIVLISDLHVGPHLGPADVERVVAASNALEPDLVVLLGDIVAYDPADAAVVAAGAPRLVAPLGVYAVAGNHDYFVDQTTVARLLEAAGVRVLRNAGLPLERQGARLWLAGVDDLRRGRPDLASALAGAAPGDVPVLLTHNPMLAHPAAALGVPLVLAGHTHGGQVQLPVVGPLLLPIPDRRLAEGLVALGATQVYITRGVGVGTPPARLGARPEIPLIILRRG